MTLHQDTISIIDKCIKIKNYGEYVPLNNHMVIFFSPSSEKIYCGGYSLSSISWPKEIQKDEEKTFALAKDFYYQLILRRLLHDKE